MLTGTLSVAVFDAHSQLFWRARLIKYSPSSVGLVGVPYVRSRRAVAREPLTWN